MMVPTSRRLLLMFAALCLAWSCKVSAASGRSSGLNEGRRKTLVVYVFSDTDPEYFNNFMFFLREGMRPGPNERIKDTNYIIIVQSDDPDKEDVSRLPRLPSNAVYVVHKNECYDWGTYGWLLTAGLVEIDETYTHFIFINCSVRGPYMPLYSRGLTDWKSAFLDHLTDTVKLVGPVISCESVHTPQGDAFNPHVQSYVVATDRVGLKILMDSKEVFQCHQKWEDAVLHAELASSRHILDAGYNIGALMLRYQGVDFRKESNWGCNTRSNPFKYNSYDGLDMNPYEVMFVKFKHSYLYMKNPTVTRAIQIEMALNATGNGPRALARTNMQDAHDFAGKQVCWSQMQGAQECFDAAAYRAKYPEYAKLSDEAVWQQYLTTDQFTDREARVTCMKRQPTPKVLPNPLAS